MVIDLIIKSWPSKIIIMCGRVTYIYISAGQFQWVIHMISGVETDESFHLRFVTGIIMSVRGDYPKTMNHNESLVAQMLCV